MKITTPLEPVTFELPREDVFRPVWQVTMQEDGSLQIIASGRRTGRVHVIPCSHTSIIVTTDQIPK